MNFYDRLNSLIKTNGLSQRKLEIELGLSNGSISKWKKYSPNAEKVQLLADYFGVTVEYLMTGKETLHVTSNGDNILYEINQNPDLRLLLEIGRKAPPDRLKTYVEFLNKITEEGGESEKGRK